ncbi:MAG: hypothetical protein AAFY02_18835 [Pseudomonadota bacterium]
MHLRIDPKPGRILGLVAALALLAGCQQIDNALLPGTSAGSVDGGVQLGSTNFTVPGVTQFPSTGTAVGDRIEQLRDELEDLQDMVRSENETLQTVRSNVRTNAVAYNQTVAAINTRLQVGTTPGNPNLVSSWEQARAQLDQINTDASRLTGLMSEVSGSSAMAGFLLEATQATFTVRGAVDADHQQLAVLQDETRQTAITIDRLMNELTTDVSRTSGFLAAERNNLTTLAVAVDNGQYIGTSLASLSSGVPAPPPFGGAQSLVGTREPLVVIRFDRANVNYDAPLYAAVSAALERRPNAAFDVVSVSPGSTQARLNSARGRQNAERVVRSLANMGLPLDRIGLAATSSPAVQVDEVYVYVR